MRGRYFSGGNDLYLNGMDPAKKSLKSTHANAFNLLQLVPHSLPKLEMSARARTKAKNGKTYNIVNLLQISNY